MLDAELRVAPVLELAELVVERGADGLHVLLHPADALHCACTRRSRLRALAAAAAAAAVCARVAVEGTQLSV